ncbi:hypothetical protein FHN55_18045 [Streptomyces sp. NP160]|uniref:hypothetical protein n=1 Tax=Streptomyces sp. NP160 TaxID=2586637 RepID=UPI00111A3D04|nr:hypothetical protein [Streptomyces sp. NP160]TNM60677.1 hypothetical protein FHN55_18045 [Streptomyces sp. NP160]
MSTPSSPALQLLRRAQDRDLAGEGIPVALALLDETGADPAAASAVASPADAALVAQLDALRAELAPDQRDGDLGVIASLVTAAAFHEAEQLGRPAPEAGPPPPSSSSRTGRARLGWRRHREALAAGRVLRVVNYHNTPEHGRDGLRAELARFAEHWVGVGWEDLLAFYAAGAWPDDRPRFAPVFYEGYANSAQVAAPVCEELGLTGWFPVCTGFLQCPPAQQELFARSHFIAVDPAERDGRRLAMSPEEAAALAGRHVVLPHTSSHDGIGETSLGAGEDDVEREVAAPLRLLQEWTGGRAAPATAWMGGTPWGLHPGHDAAVRAAGHQLVISNTAVQRVAAGDAAQRAG